MNKPLILVSSFIFTKFIEVLKVPNKLFITFMGKEYKRSMKSSENHYSYRLTDKPAFNKQPLLTAHTK